MAYFYFDFNDPGKLLFRSFIHSMVAQLLFQGPGTPVALKDLCVRNHDGTQQPNLDDLIAILKAMVGLFGQTYIVIDALDECTGSEREGILKFLAKMKSWDLQNLHVLATSRPVPEIEDATKRLCASRVDLKSETSPINHDIERCLQELLENNPDLQKWGTTEKTLIKENLIKRAGGMYVKPLSG